MIDAMEKASVQDLLFAKIFGIDEDMVKRTSLLQMKNELHTKAFRMRKQNVTIPQAEADELNKRLNEIIEQLEDFGYDPMQDYIVDFDNFVVGNDQYHRFCW